MESQDSYPRSHLGAPPKRSWWARLSKLKKILLVAVLAFIVLALSLGLGLGLGLRKHGSDDDSNVDESELPPIPPTNGTVWQPRVGAAWQIVLDEELDVSRTPLTPDVEIYDVDLFVTQKQTIDKLHSLGKKVICYFSAGTIEDWRPDAKKFKKSDIGKAMDEWPGEWWLDVRSKNVLDVAKSRIDMASERGCDAVDPDNVDGYQNDSGFDFTATDSAKFVRNMAIYAAGKNMSTGLKNAASIIPAVLPVIQFSVNEQCAEFNECDTFAAFIRANKPVFHIEYPKNIDKISISRQKSLCDEGGENISAKTMSQFSTVLKHMKLDGYVRYCDGKTATTRLVPDSGTKRDDGE